MRIFEFFVEDDRYTVPTLELVETRDVECARQLASERMYASSHHRSVEVWTATDRLFVLSRQETFEGAREAIGSTP